MSAQSELPSKTKRVPFKDWKLVQKDDKLRQMTPTVYTQEMLQSTEERFASNKEITLPRVLELLDMSKSSQHKFSFVDVDQPIFQPYPSELVFQNFTPTQSYSLQLNLFNNDKVSRKVRLELQDSDFFQVAGLKNDGCKVAPGMSAAFNVCFTPQENKDYQHSLVFVTERERFEVPIFAIGPRAILDFRDEILLPACPVKYSTERTHLVRNIGNCTAKFMLQTQRPFSVTPTCGTLDVGESMQVTVSFNPQTMGDHMENLILHYHSGEDVYISLYGVGEELSIQLQPDFVPLQKTYISLSTVHTVSFTNRYDIPLKYFWTVWPSLQEEAVSMLSDGLVLSQRDEAERDQLIFQCESDPAAIHGLPQLCTALQRHRSQCLQDSGITFSHSWITVEPAEGEIWPNMTTQFFIVFKPEEAKLCEQTIYFDITGCESRLPFSVVGEAIGPQIQFNYNIVDMKNVFVSDKGSYELELSNVGLINAPFSLSLPDTSFGRCFAVAPQEGVVPPGTRQIVEVTFSSHILGDFSEDLLLTVSGQPEPPKVTFRGCVIGPTFHFDVLELDFGDVGFGFPKTLTCSLFNTSCVPMTISLRVLGDGLGAPSVSYDKQLSDTSRTNWEASAAKGCHARPMELTISPASGSVPPMSDFPIEVKLCANTAKRYWLAMAVDVKGVGNEVGTLPINARCVVPDIVVETPLLNFQRCFLDYPYEQSVCLTNPGTVPTCYGVLDKKYEENPSIQFGSPAPRGVIYPQSSVEIPVFLLAKATGTLQHSLRIAVFGSCQPPLEVILSCVGQGPTVHVQSSQLDFGKIQVLTDSTRTLQLLNQSPIPASFTARMNGKKSFWRVEPSEGEVSPGGQLELSVVANLKDTLRFEDRLEVFIQDSKTHTVPLSATGTGTTITTDRPFAPSLDLGTYFSPGSCHYRFKLTNQGLRTQRLYWRTDASHQSRVAELSGRTVLPPITVSKKDSWGEGASLRERAVFSLSPSRLELFPGCSIDVVLSGSSDSSKVVQERLVCQAIIGSQSTNEQIMSVDVTCRFVATMLSISPKELNFYMSKAKGKRLIPLYEKLSVRNVSTRNLSLNLLLAKPFSLCEAAGVRSAVTKQSLLLDEGGQAELWICYDPAHYCDQVSQIIDEVLQINYQGHTQQDLVKLHAEIHFPNIDFSSTTVDFGCVLNYTETRREIWITNCSPMSVSYRWTFLVDEEPRTITTLKPLKEVEKPISPLIKTDYGRNSFVSLRPDANEDEPSHVWSAVGAFDILPSFGHLQPGEKQKLALCFYAQENVDREIIALCHVEEGPTYKLKLRGEASVINYSVHPTLVDFDKQMFDHEAEVEVTLRNTGKVGFNYAIVDPDMEVEADGVNGRLEVVDQPDSQQVRALWPGRPAVIPATGYIEAGAEQTLRVLYLPGVPDVFEKRLLLKVAFLPPQVITLTGVGIFPRISLNLPTNLADKSYSDVVQQARLAVEVVEEFRSSSVETSPTLSHEEVLHMEIERRLVKENALALIAGQLELGDAQEASKKWHKLSKFLLPEYVLDFGHVILGQVLSHTVAVINNGTVAVSFQANPKALAGTGFTVEFERVKNLPCGETQTFTVKFDTQGSSVKMGDISVVMPIQVLHGPTVQVRLRSVVTQPSLTVSPDSLHFDTIPCGMCQMRTIQLFNHKPVPCCWSIAEEINHLPKVDKFLPFYQRKKLIQQQRPPPAVFEMTPCSGVLSPAERVNVQIKFSPAEGLVYCRQLVISMAESTHQIHLTARGVGEEPQLEFCPAELQLGPCLPNSTQTEAEVTVKNPCSFPIEFYSLELDTQYIEEEKVLSIMQGYDEKNALLLPPRAPGEGLPEELQEHYAEYCTQLAEKDQQQESMDEGKTDTNDSDSVKRSEGGAQDSTLKTTDLLLCNIPREGGSGKLGQLEITPVARAIARHMSVDLSPEGFAARNRTGIAIIVYGGPLTGKGKVAQDLAQHYGGACLSVDNVVTDALLNGSSAVSLRARQLYNAAASQYSDKKSREPVVPSDEVREAGSAGAERSQNFADAPIRFGRRGSVRTISKSTERASEPHSALWLGGDVNSLRNILPEQVLVDILTERFQQRDCHRGIVMCGLDSVFIQPVAATLQMVLKAINNRKHIYVVNLSLSYAVLKAREKLRRVALAILQRGRASMEGSWLQGLDEEKCDALTEEEQEKLMERYRVKMRQMKLREMEKTQREQQEKNQELEMKKLKEEELKKKGKKPVKKDPKEGTRRKTTQDGKQSSTDATRKSSGSNSKESLGEARETPTSSEAPYSKEPEEESKAPPPISYESFQPTEVKADKPKPSVDVLQSQFQAYEQSQEQVEHILRHWDRALLVLLVPVPTEDSVTVSEEAVSEKRTSQSKKSKKATSKVLSPMTPQLPVPVEPEKKETLPPREIIPSCVLKVTGEEDCPSVEDVLSASSLPSVDQVLDDMGIGPSGPPVPPPVTLSIVPFPKARAQADAKQICDCFTFLVPSKSDEAKRDSEEEEPSAAKDERATTPFKKRGGAAASAASKRGRESQKVKRRSRLSSMSTCSEPSQVNNQATLEQKRQQSLTSFRWVVPANGEVSLRIWFYRDSPGKFEQTFNFELVGTRRNYQLPCKGICSYPSICKDYRTLFPNCKAVSQRQEGIKKTYVINPGYFEFGHLLCGKTRDRFKETKYLENTEKLLIHNDSGLEVEVQFQFQQDTSASTYLVDPSMMVLKPEEKQEVTVWAYPTKVGLMRDSLLCSIKENPEIISIDFSCWGVRPELKMDTRHFHFDRILLHRQDSRTVTLRNRTALPVSWRLQGVEELGDEFTVPQDHGIIQPKSSLPVTLHFRAKRPLHIKKVLRLEISDVEKILGVVHTENLQVSAEAYEIALDISPDGLLDFGTMRVFEENKLSLKMKNQGKHEIAYKFIFPPTELTKSNLLTVAPKIGSLKPYEKSTTVQIICSPTKELCIKEKPLLSFEVIEPSLGKGGETVAILAIKVSVTSVFSSYKITPACDINFGPLVYGNRKSQAIVIKNTGLFETQFTISRMILDPALMERPGGSSKRAGQGSQSERTSATNGTGRRETFQKEARPAQSILTMGVFTVAPCVATLQPGGQQVVTVNCAAEQLGKWNLGLLIDISDRDPADHPRGIPYRLMAEICKPGILLDMPTIFEEHYICPNSSQLTSEKFCNARSIYIQEENKFLFNKVLVGQTARARFKLTNNGKVPCTLNFSVKHVAARALRNMEVFELATPSLNVQSQSHMFAEVTFTPQTIQLYNAVFEVAMEGASRMTPPFRSKLLEFDLVGEGNLPSVCVLRPVLRSREGSPMLQFRRVLVGRRCTLPLVLVNDGIVPSQVQLHMADEDRVFTLKPSPANTCTSVQFARLEDATESESQPGHRVTISLNIGEQVELEVSFSSDKPLNVKTKMLLQVADNQYNETAIQVSGEAYQEVVSVSNISRSLQEVDVEDGDEGNYEVLNFGDCYVGHPYRESFTMTNHTDSQVVKFHWPSTGPHISFSPKVGHIHAGCSKEVTVTFCSSEPVALASHLIKCKICQVEFQQPVDQVVDWDDRKRTVQWLDPSQQARGTPESHVKNKVVNTDPEPSCAVVPGSQWELVLCIKAVCDYVQYSCTTEAIHFNDTMLYQSRLYQLQLINQGKVKFDYSFQVLLDSSTKTASVRDRDDESATSRPCSRAGRESSEVRPASALASVISALTLNPALSPFTVEPVLGTIEPGAMQSFNIRFAPLEVAQFEGTLVCSIPSLQEEFQAPCIPLFGRCLLPYCHFDLEDSDYPVGTGGDDEVNGLLDSNTRVVQFNAVGVSQPLTRRFSVLNPTNKQYSFKWMCENTGACPFRCLTPSGTMQPGKKVELCFEYVPEQVELVVQSSWSFVIDTLSVSIPFICIGTSREPLVYFSKPYVEFGEILVGQRAEKVMDLVNGEQQPFGFCIVQSSLLCDDQQSSLTVHPMSGTVAPKDRLPLSVRFTPCRDGHVSFRMVLKVKRKTEPLAIAVKADCFAMSASLQVSMPGTELRDVNPNHPDTLDFGKVEIAENHVCYFVLTNLARFNLEVSLEATGPCELLQYLEATPKKATTDVGTQLQLQLSFCPKNICNLQNIVLSIKVKLGPTFIFVVQGTAVEPCLEFSFTKFNFGKCFLYCPGMVPTCQTLVMSNRGAKGISVQSQFKENAFLEIDFQPDIVPPGGVVEVPIYFYPRELCHYHKKITFIFNSCITRDVDILGQGVEMKLEVEDLKHKKVRLRSVMLGQKVEKQVALVNRSPVDVSFTVLVTNTLLDPKELSVSPAGELSLRGNGGSCKIYILFTPQHHIPSFTAELQADCAGLLHPLLTVQGCCQGVKVHLAQDRLAFGAIVQRCHSQRRIVMINTGDLGGRFQWKTGSFPPELSITPTKGYICPGMEVPFEVTFAPLELSEDIRYENLSCFVEGAPSPVTLTVTGSCAAASTSKEVVNFVCPVRGSLTQTLNVTNPTNQQCTISPVIEGEQWSAAPTILFEPLQNKTYIITYRPLTMTVDGQKHQGSIFFSFPDGTGMLYSLQGTTEPPKAEDTIVHQLPAKTQHSQLLTVHNWMSEQQRFHVVIDFLKPEKPDPTVSLKGVEYIDVPSLATRKYKMSFYTYKEGQYQTRVTFRNVTTGEYMFYLVTFEATSPGVLSTIKLVTAVRRVASASVAVENPLSTPVCFTTECRSPDISAPPQTTVPGHSKGVLNFEYQPLRAGDFTVRLSLCNNELGFFHFELQLRALPPPPEKTVYFTTYLGSSYTALATFINYSRIKTEYACKMDSTDFFVDRSVSASPGFQAGSETSVEVCFEPHKLGEVKGQLSLSSGFGGEYVFPLHGVCLPPKAQGPFSIRSGRHITIPFKNVFLQTTAFSFQVDKPYFTVRGVEPIPSKKTQNIMVAFEVPLDGSQGPWLGKMTVSSQRSEGHNKPCSWVFYLRGFDPSSS